MKDKLCWCSCHPIHDGRPIMFLHCSACEPEAPNRTYESPFDIFPVATWVLVVGIPITGLALIYLTYFYV